MIALLGNPFSPAYARARARGRGRALSFSSMNVALYARGAGRWALHERPIGDGDREATSVGIGKSSMRWDGDRLVVDLDERTTPLRRAVRGRVVLHPEAHTCLEIAIDERGAHRWWPVAPLARVEVDLVEPRVRFSGHGYYDANAGDVPLQSSFEDWSWSRARAASRALLTYDVACSSGAERAVAFAVDARGAVEPIEGSSRTRLSRTRWGLARHTRVDDGRGARVVRSLEDGPFYARALVETHLGGARVVAMHEQLAAHRLRRAWVRHFTGYKMRSTT